MDRGYLEGSMKVGDLVKNVYEAGEDSVVWLVLKTSSVDPLVLVQSLRTGERLWGNTEDLEVVNESR